VANITNIKRLQGKLAKLADKYHDSGTMAVVVGYSANYAVFVHERQAKHQPGKQWKFLEQPARQLGSTMGDMVAKAMAGGVKMLQALYLAGLRLQRDSQAIVPVDTGNLRGGAFTAREDDLESVAAAAAVTGGKVRNKELTRRTKLTNKQQKMAAFHAKRVHNALLKRKKALDLASQKYVGNEVFFKNLRKANRNKKR